MGTVRRLRYEGEIPYVQIGRGKIIYLAESILRWLKLKEVNESNAGPSNTHVEQAYTNAQPMSIG